MKLWGIALVVLCLLVAVSGQDTPPAAAAGQDAASPSTRQSQTSDDPAKNDSKEALLDLTPNADGRLSQEQMQALLRVVADKDEQNNKLLRNYTYVERDVDHKLDGSGQVKSTETRTYEVLEIYGEQVQRLIEKDGKPLDSKEAAKEEEKIQKIIDKRRNESEEDRKKREAQQEKEREDGRKFVHEIANAYNFTLAGTELIDGREAWEIAGEPRPGFEPEMKYAKFLPKFHGKVWIDKADLQMAKVDVEAIDTVAIGWVLARVHKGSRFIVENTRVNDEVWLPKHVTFKFDARVALFKGYNMDGEQTFREYKKFHTSARVVGATEAKEQK